MFRAPCAKSESRPARSTPHVRSEWFLNSNCSNRCRDLLVTTCPIIVNVLLSNIPPMKDTFNASVCRRRHVLPHGDVLRPRVRLLLPRRQGLDLPRALYGREAKLEQGARRGRESLSMRGGHVQRSQEVRGRRS